MKNDKVNINKLLNVTLISYFSVLLIMLSFSKLAGEDDLFWYLSTGRYIVQSGIIPSYDVFGFTTSGVPWIPFEWGWDIINYLLFTAGGYIALTVLEVLLILLIFFLVFRMHLKFKIHYSVSIITLLLLAFGILQRMSIKPHLVSYLALVILLSILIRYRYFERNNQKILFFIPLIFLLWINLHMGVIAGFFLFGLFIASEIAGIIFKKNHSIRPLTNKEAATLIFVFILSAAVTLINPHGIKTYEYAFHIVSMKQLKIIYEWKSPFSPEYLQTFGNIIYYFYIVLILPVIYYSFRKKDFFPVIAVIGFFINSTRSYRFIADFMIVSVPLIALALNYTLLKLKFIDPEQKAADKKTLRITFSVILLLLIVIIPNNNFYNWISSPRKFGYGIDTENFPVGMYKFVINNGIADIAERPLNTYETGGYFTWNFPDKKSFIGSRGLNDEVWNQYFTIINTAPGFEYDMDYINFDYVMWMVPLLNYSEQPALLNYGLLHFLFTDSLKWRLLYWDDTSFLFVKNEPKFEKLISGLEYKYFNPFNFYFRRKIIDMALETDETALLKEIERKKSENPGGNFFKTMLNHYRNRLE